MALAHLSLDDLVDEVSPTQEITEQKALLGLWNPDQSWARPSLSNPQMYSVMKGGKGIHYDSNL